MRLSSVAVLLVLSCVPGHARDQGPQPGSPADVEAGQVGAFVYLPAQTKEVAPNQVASIGGPVIFERNIDVLVRAAVIRRMRSGGMRLGNPDKELSGEIQACQIIKYIDAPAECSLSIRYRVTQGAALICEITKDVRTRRCFAAQAALDDAIEQNIQELVAEAAFSEALK